MVEAMEDSRLLSESGAKREERDVLKSFVRRTVCCFTSFGSGACDCAAEAEAEAEAEEARGESGGSSTGGWSLSVTETES